jgi:hypothetical protein
VFFEQRNGNARLMASLTEKLSETAPIWKRAVAPVAEWVAQALWNSRKNADSEQLLPSRLTQRRRSEGRGNSFRRQAASQPLKIKVCPICGAEGVKNRYCRSCGVEVSRDNLSRAALIGPATREKARAKARRSKALSDHAVANTWWEPSSLPTWLTAEFYQREIQPKLRTLKVREIAEALHLSQQYAALIRAGRRRPHPRHWEALTKLVGVSAPERITEVKTEA